GINTVAVTIRLRLAAGTLAVFAGLSRGTGVTARATIIEVGPDIDTGTTAADRVNQTALRSATIDLRLVTRLGRGLASEASTSTSFGDPWWPAHAPARR